MRKLSMLALIFMGVVASVAVAAETRINISSPVDGAKLDVNVQNKLEYNITQGGKGDHVHVYVDGKQEALLRRMKGSYTFDPMKPGMHEICIKIVNRNHTPIGENQCVKVEVQ